MHILVIPTTYPNKYNQASGIFFQHQAHSIKRAGFTVGVLAPILISLRRIPRGLFRYEQRMTVNEEEGVPTFRYYQWAWFSQVKNGDLFLWERAASRMFEEYVTRYGRPDIIHAQEAKFAGIFASKIKRTLGIPYILTEHSTAFARGLVRDWQIPGLLDAFQNASHRVVVSPQLGSMVERTLGKVVCPWTPIPNILDTLFSETPVAPKEIRGKPFRFLNIALMTEKKGQSDLLKALSRSLQRIENVELRLGGDGPIRKDLQRLTTQLGIEEKVRFLGMLNREQVMEEMQGCDVFVLPSHYETFGVVLIEALACGKPIVSTACGGPESIVNPANGILVPVGDIDALADSLERMYHEICKYDPVKIRTDCLNRYHENVIVQSLSEIYRAVTTARGEFQGI